MKTYILFWNPAISSYKLDDFQKEMEDLGNADMNWSVWEYEKACAGDRFFMVRCGSGKTGICMSGYFSSNPYKGEDWSGRGRITYYMNLEPDYMINPDYLPILSTLDLVRDIPGFDWNGGHSGRLLDAKLAAKLEAIWKKFTDDHAEMFTMRAAHQEVDPEKFRNEDNAVTVYLYFTEEGKIQASYYPFDIEIEGDNIDDVKKRATEILGEKIGKDYEVKFAYDDIDEKDFPLYEKTIRLVLDNKKAETTFEESYWDFEEKVVYLLHMVDVSSAVLRSQGFPAVIITANDALSRKTDESLIEYVKRAADNNIAKSILRDEIYEALHITEKESLNVDDLKILNENLAALHYLDSLAKKE